MGVTAFVNTAFVNTCSPCINNDSRISRNFARALIPWNFTCEALIVDDVHVATIITDEVWEKDVSVRYI